MSTDDRRKVLGIRLRELRRAAGLSAAALGLAAGRSGDFLRQVERGERRPSPGTLRAVVPALGESDAQLEGLLDLGPAMAMLADERPERRRSRSRAIARDDATRSAALARGDWPTALAAADRTLAALGSPALTTDELQAQIDEWSSPAELAKLQAQIDEACSPAVLAKLQEQIDEWSSPAALARLQEQLDEPLAEPETEPFAQ